MRYLKQSTAVDVALGPFLDATDGVTAETALTISQADVRLKKNAAAWAQKNEATSATHEENGWYEVPLNTTDTDTLGVLMIAVHESGALPVWHEFMVVPANVYDSLFSTDLLQVDAREWLGGTIATPTVTGVPEVDVTHFNGAAGTFASGRPEVNTSHIAGTSQTARDIGASVLLSSGTGTGQISLSSGLVTLAGVTHTGAVIPTVTTLTGHTAQTGDSYAIVNSGTHGNAALKTLIDAVDDYVDTEVAAIKAKTDNLPAAPAATGDIPSAATIATAVLTTAMTEAYAADGATFTVAQALYEIAQSIGDFSISGTTLTVKKRDGSTTAATYTLNDSASPTSRTRAT